MLHLKRKFLNAAEAFRLAAEFRQFRAALPELRAKTPPGDGHPVLVIPGFSSPDLPTLPPAPRVE